MEGASKKRESVTVSWRRMELLHKKIERFGKEEGNSCSRMKQELMKKFGK